MKKTISALFISTLFSAILLPSNLVKAAPVTVDTKTSDAAVLFKEKDNPLVINQVPDLHFGTQELDRNNAHDYPTIASGSHIGKTTLTSTNLVKITDDRSQAKLDGWVLQVAQSDFVNAGTTSSADADPSDSLAGVNIWFDLAKGNLVGDNLGDAALTTTGDSKLQLNSQAATLMSGGATAFGEISATLGTAPVDATPGEGIYLHVPKTVNPKADTHYQSNLTWTLVASPENV